MIQYNMRFFFLYVLGFWSLFCSAATDPVETTTQGRIFFSFTENKGQIADQHMNSRPDVLFSGFTGGFIFHLRNSGVSYQFSRTINSVASEKQSCKASKICRIDVNWPGSNITANVSGSEPLDGHCNFYLDQCPEGALNVKSYRKVLYQNLYAGIDLKWYQVNGSLKYDYEVSAGADYRQITLDIKGADKIRINSKGSLVIETPIGNIIEEAPIVIQQGIQLVSKWILKEGTASFEIFGIDPNLPFVIDPIVREWGTYYGGSGNDYSSGMSEDLNGNIFISGYTTSTGTTLATSGAHQVNYGGNNDAFLMAMNPSGLRLWSTYYGGNTSYEEGVSCSPDLSGNVYLLGYANSSTVIATSGAHQSSLGGSYDAFLVKFNSSGARQWATWYGGSGSESAGGCATDASGNVFISGPTSTSSGTAIASNNAFQAFGFSFLAKFNPNGQRLWGTYFGDDGTVSPRSLATNTMGDVFMAGATTATGSAMTTTGAHQLLNGGGTDAFLCKFSSNGALLWSTFYGGSGSDQAKSCAVNVNGEVYIAGATTTSVSNVINSPASHQITIGGSSDGFLAKFDSMGVRLWATYYGGSQNDDIAGCSLDPIGNIYICGTTESTAAIATSAAYQSSLGGNSDVFVALFNSNGLRQWATYYGDNTSDVATDCVTHSSGSIYVCGATGGGATTGILSSADALQTTFGGSFYDGLIFKLIDCVSLPPAPSIITPSVNLFFCANGSATITASSNGTLSWYAVPSGSFPISSGSNFVTPNLFSNTTYYIEDKFCGSSLVRTPVTVTVSPLPTLTVSGLPGVCPGASAIITAAGANTYTWAPSNSTGQSLTITPITTNQYTVTGTDVKGCENKNVFSLAVYPTPTLILSASPPSICEGKTVSINVSGASVYSLNGIALVPPFLISPTITSNFNIDAISNYGCFATSAITVSVKALPVLTVASTQATICAGETVTLTASGASSYTWDFIPGTSEYTMMPTGTANYLVSGTGSNGCTNSISVVQYVDECTGINKIKQAELFFDLYPNPGKGYYVLNSNEAAVLEVFDLIGQLVFTDSIQIGKHELDLRQFSQGIYLVRLTNKNAIRSMRLIYEY